MSIGGIGKGCIFCQKWFKRKRSWHYEQSLPEYKFFESPLPAFPGLVNRMAPDDVFLFLINPPSKNKPVQKLIAKYVFDCCEKRRSLVL